MMNISSVSTTPASAPGFIAPISPAQVQGAAQAQTAAALIAQTTVDLSPLGRFLSAVTLFQKRMLELQANPAAAAAELASEQGASELASAVAAVAASANELQASSLTGTSDDQSLANLFSQQFAAQAGPDGETDTSTLAAIGLTFTSVSGLDEGDILNVDTSALQAALINDPGATTTLLARTGSAFAALAGVVGTSEDPTVLLSDEASPFDLPGQPPQALAGLPDFGAPAAAPFSTDGAFLQELLAETPRPPLAQVQAAPPAFTEATASFEAQRLVLAGEAPRATAADNPAALQANPPPAQPGAAASSLVPDIDSRNIAQSAGPALPQPATGTAARASAQPADGDPQSSLPPQAGTQAAAAQATRLQQDQQLDAQDAARSASLRLADSITAEREASERIGNSIATQRAEQGDQDNMQALDEAMLARAAGENTEQRRLARDVDQTRLDRAREASELDVVDIDASAPHRERMVTVMRQPVLQADEAPDPAVPPPPLQPLNNAQLLARDPAVAAAIAAYNLSAGPFAALNGRPELGAPRPRVIPAVQNVTKVTAIETDAATSESSRPFR
jgi:hypothetical protein